VARPLLSGRVRGPDEQGNEQARAHIASAGLFSWSPVCAPPMSPADIQKASVARGNEPSTAKYVQNSRAASMARVSGASAACPSASTKK